jgi:hypothetical protein
VAPKNVLRGRKRNGKMKLKKTCKFDENNNPFIQEIQ